MDYLSLEVYFSVVLIKFMNTKLDEYEKNQDYDGEIYDL